MLKLYQNPFKYLRWFYHTYGDLVTLAQGTATYVCAFGPALNFQLLSDPHLFEVGGDTPLAKFRKDTALGKLMAVNLTQMPGSPYRPQCDPPRACQCVSFLKIGSSSVCQYAALFMI
jgi:hypothetical protein